VGIFGTSRDLLDSLYQYPGGWLADRAGTRRALLILTAVATCGYAVYALAPAWPVMIAGLLGVMAWKAGAFPLTFSIIGESLAPERRATAFAVQSVLVRLPRVISAPLGGLIIAALGMLAGFKVLAATTVVIALVVLIVQHRAFHPAGAGSQLVAVPAPAGRIVMIAPDLRRLLVAECLVRIGEAIAASFVVLYVTQVIGLSAVQYGSLYALQQAVAILTYLPGARLAAFAGRRPVVAMTFVFFAVFPLAVRLASNVTGLIAAFVLGGLKELGEPARKSMIVDLTPDTRRASSVGAYYTVRNLVVVPGGVIGGVLWERGVHLPLEAAFVVAFTGVIVYTLAGFPTTSGPPPGPRTSRR
jgi:MFS family permease